jgi:hypothetical protein
MKRRFLRREHGAATVEFAIVAILLLTLVFGIIEFGILMFDKHVLTNASREGARAGVVMRIPRLPDVIPSPSVGNEGIKDIVLRYASEHMVTFGPSGRLDFDDIVVLPAEVDRVGPSLFGTALEVKVEYQFDFLFLSTLGLGPITLKAKTIMRME